MPRARNIKPSFFDNDELADSNCALGRLLFIGLWTISDYRGNLEWRPKKVKATLLPYDDCDIVRLAINLDKSGFIRFYSVQGVIYLNIVNFVKHQNPHKNERDKGTDILGFDSEGSQVIVLEEVVINPDKNGTNPDLNASDPADPCLLIPDPCSLIPNSGLPLKGLTPPPEEPPKKDAKPKKKPVDTKATWRSYIDGYCNRYGVEPLRNKQTNSQMAQFCRSVALDEAPLIAAYYVMHNEQWFVKSSHSVGILLQNAQKLRTEWATNTMVTSTTARQIDNSQSNANAVQEAIRISREQGKC